MAFYTQYTQATFTAELASALNDPNHVYWAQDELNRALNEALLLWGALTGAWTVTALFNTTAGQPFYDLSAQLPTFRTRAYTLGNLTREIQYHLLEPASGVSGAGMTAQFTIGQITNALERRRNQFVLDSRAPLTFSTVAAPAPPDNVVTLDQSVSLITRAAWIDATTGIVTPLRRTDPFGSQSYNPVWNLNPAKPYGYSQVESMPGTLVLVPPPAGPGSIHLTYAQTLALATADGTSLALPDEFAFAVKYGAMYEAMSTNSQGYDPIRSKYCSERYDAAIELSKAFRCLLRVRLNDTPLSMTTIADLDSGKPFWQTGTGTPNIAASAYDLVAFHKVPNTVYSITCEVVQSAPLPVATTDPVNVGREELPYIFDYCRHILQLKLGGTEFIQSMPLYDNFLKGASQRTTLIGVKARYLTPLFTTAQEQEQESNAA